MKKIHVIHENDAWIVPLREALTELNLPFEEWYTDTGVVRFDAVPPDGVFYNRMSASSHTRGHRHAPEMTHAVLTWLERHGRRVANGTRALYLEISKIAQYAALERVGVRCPQTLAVVGRENVVAGARSFGAGPWIVKPNRGGKGLGVALFHTIEAIEDYLSGDVDDPVDGIWLVQEYIRSNEPFITRCEFVGGRFLYAVRVDASRGFELCPADACSVEDAFCPTDGTDGNRFTIQEDPIDPDLIERYERFLRENDIEIAGIEFLRDMEGEIVTYDVNTNTNYNSAAEAKAGIPLTGMHAIARFLGEELARVPSSSNFRSSTSDFGLRS